MEDLNFGEGITSLTSIDLSNLPNLKYFTNSDTSNPSAINSLDFSNNPKMISISSHHSNITSINIDNCTELNGLLLWDSSSLSGTLDISHIKSTADVRLKGTRITCLEVNNEQMNRRDLLLEGSASGKFYLDWDIVTTDCSDPSSVTFSYSYDVKFNSLNSNYLIEITDSAGTITISGPTLHLKIGETITFNVDAPNHPFYIKTAQGIGTNDLVTGITNNGTTSGTISWTPTTAGTYYYQCSLHSEMNGTIIVN